MLSSYLRKAGVLLLVIFIAIGFTRSEKEVEASYFYDTVALAFEGTVNEIIKYGDIPVTYNVNEPIRMLAQFENIVEAFVNFSDIMGVTYFGGVEIAGMTYRFESLHKDIRSNPFYSAFVQSEEKTTSFMEFVPRGEKLNFSYGYEGKYIGSDPDFTWKLNTSIRVLTDTGDGILNEKTPTELTQYLNKLKEEVTPLKFTVIHEDVDSGEKLCEYKGTLTLDNFATIEEIVILDDFAELFLELGSLALDIYLAFHGIGPWTPTSIINPEAFADLTSWFNKRKDSVEYIDMYAALSPVDLVLTDNMGNLYDKETSIGDNFFYLEGDIFGIGENKDIIFITDGAGEVDLDVLPEQGAKMDDKFSLIACRIGGKNILAREIFNNEEIGNGRSIRIDTDQNFAPAPEPSTLALLVLGFGILVGYKSCNILQERKRPKK